MGYHFSSSILSLRTIFSLETFLDTIEKRGAENQKHESFQEWEAVTDYVKVGEQTEE